MLLEKMFSVANMSSFCVVRPLWDVIWWGKRAGYFSPSSRISAVPMVGMAVELSLLKDKMIVSGLVLVAVMGKIRTMF